MQTAKPSDKLYRLSDGGNLYFCVRTSNSRSWQFRYNAYFGAFRSVISGLSDHPFRFKPITDSAIIRSLLA
ncbi:Arm DNA-binding domain-containing protein [Vibrio vulnificus]|uniref:Arm DNA-binding domain-containing protein n=1 Tax=Vibrio vulnificus TaxID=672 RepID=UPI0030FEB753